MNTILVTGATGTVGGEVVKQLASSSLGHEVVRAGVHSPNKADKLKQYKTVEIVNMDYNKPETITTALQDIDELFWLTTLTPNTTQISSNLIKEANKNYVKHIVKLSVMGADTEPITTISRLHRQEEKIIEESGIPYTFLRPVGFMQNFINFFGQTIKNQNTFYLPAGDGKVSFVDVRDIASVAVQTLVANDDNQHTGKAYGITGDELLSYEQVAEILSKEVGKKINYVNISDEDARKSMKSMGMEDWLIDGMMELYNGIRGGHASLTTNTVEQILGQKPISFSQFAKDYAEFFR
ncbi:MAG: SDR family oxidoreductase [Candidatus Nitrosocosmicus sp.]